MSMREYFEYNERKLCRSRPLPTKSIQKVDFVQFELVQLPHCLEHNKFIIGCEACFEACETAIHVKEHETVDEMTAYLPWFFVRQAE